MSEIGSSVPRLLSWIFERLFPGPLGKEVGDDLELEYRKQRPFLSRHTRRFCRSTSSW